MSPPRSRLSKTSRLEPDHASATMQPRSNRQVLQQLITTLKYSNFPEQKQHVLQLLKSNPQLMAAFIKQRSGHQQQPPPQPPLGVPTITLGGMPQGEMASLGTSTTMQPRSHKQVLQQLLTSLKSSDYPQQKQHVMQLLKSNPQLMAAFIKQRSGQQQQPPPQPGQPQQQPLPPPLPTTAAADDRAAPHLPLPSAALYEKDEEALLEIE